MVSAQILGSLRKSQGVSEGVKAFKWISSGPNGVSGVPEMFQGIMRASVEFNESAQGFQGISVGFQSISLDKSELWGSHWSSGSFTGLHRSLTLTYTIYVTAT